MSEPAAAPGNGKPERATVMMHHLDATLCRRLLARIRFGRIAYVDDAGAPVVMPVNCTFTDDTVWFRTASESPLDRAADGRPIAFEVDQVDPVAETGWSVLVRGHASRVTDPVRLAALADSEVPPWAPGTRDQWIEVTVGRITGRIIERHRLLAAGDHLPYIPPK